MDLSKFKTPDWLIIGGAIGIFIFGFLDWLSIDGGPSFNVFDITWTGFVPWELLIGAGVIVVMLRLGVIKSDRGQWPIVLLAMCGLATVLLLIRLAFNPGAEGLGRGIGMILGFVASLVSLAGAVLGYLQSTGKAVSLNINKQPDSHQPGHYPQAQPGQYPQAQPGQYPQAQPGQYPQAQPGQFPQAQPGQFPQAQPGQPEWQNAPHQPHGQPGQQPPPPPPPSS